MLPEYDFSKLGHGVRGKHTAAMRQGYSVIIHHENGTSTTRHILMVNTPNQLQLLDVIALKTSLPDHHLLAGQVGTIVEILAPDVYEIDFSDDDGQTYAMLPLHSSQLLRLCYAPEKNAQTNGEGTNPMSNTIHQYGSGKTSTR